MRNHESHIEVGREEAIELLLRAAKTTREKEMIPLAEAHGRVCGKKIHARVPVPNKTTSAMDGIAVHFADFEDGMPDVTQWQRGVDYEFCNTGVALPDGFDTAIAIECVRLEDDDHILELFFMPEYEGDRTNPPGSMLEEGTVLVRKHETFTPALLSLAAMGGNTQVCAYRKPRVAFIPTGNELVAPCENPPAGKSIDSNSIMIASKLKEWGAEPVLHPVVPDNWDELKAALLEAAEQNDLVVINAGSSKGSDDLTCEILEQEGEVFFHETDQGPGRHCSGAVLNGTVVIGISGPPVGAEFTTDWFVKPVVDYLAGRRPAPVPHIWAYLTQDLPAQPRPVNIVRRVKLFYDNEGYLWADPLQLNMPALRECDAADGFLVVPKDSYGYSYGELVSIELRWPYSATYMG